MSLLELYRSYIAVLQTTLYILQQSGNQRQTQYQIPQNSHSIVHAQPTTINLHHIVHPHQSQMNSHSIVHAQDELAFYCACTANNDPFAFYCASTCNTDELQFHHASTCNTDELAFSQQAYGCIFKKPNMRVNLSAKQMCLQIMESLRAKPKSYTICEFQQQIDVKIIQTCSQYTSMSDQFPSYCTFVFSQQAHGFMSKQTIPI
eukprot:909554_1